jgi:hypothetical protein
VEIFWVFLAMPALGLLYTAFVIGRDGEWVPGTCACSLHPSSLHSTAGMPSNVNKQREVKPISTKNLRYLVYKSDDLILIDLRLPFRATPIPLPAAHILFVSPPDLRGLLRWLPPATSVALYGETDVCASAIQICRGIPGTAPIYVLTETLAYSEIAQTYEAKQENRSAFQP